FECIYLFHQAFSPGHSEFVYATLVPKTPSSSSEPLSKLPSKLFSVPIEHNPARQLKPVTTSPDIVFFARAGTVKSSLFDDGNRLRRIIRTQTVGVSKAGYGASKDLLEPGFAFPDFALLHSRRQ